MPPREVGLTTKDQSPGEFTVVQTTSESFSVPVFTGLEEVYQSNLKEIEVDNPDLQLINIQWEMLFSRVRWWSLLFGTLFQLWNQYTQKPNE